MKINYLQIQLQSEKQERKIDGLERRFEVKIDEITKNLDQPWQVVWTEIKSFKESISQLKTQQDQLSSQEEIQKVQKQLIARQDQIFLKQDQIQSTLSEDFKQTTFTSPNSSIVSWVSMPCTSQAYFSSNYSESIHIAYFGRVQVPFTTHGHTFRCTIILE